MMGSLVYSFSINHSFIHFTCFLFIKVWSNFFLSSSSTCCSSLQRRGHPHSAVLAAVLLPFRTSRRQRFLTPIFTLQHLEEETRLASARDSPSIGNVGEDRGNQGDECSCQRENQGTTAQTQAQVKEDFNAFVFQIPDSFPAASFRRQEHTQQHRRKERQSQCRRRRPNSHFQSGNSFCLVFHFAF